MLTHRIARLASDTRDQLHREGGGILILSGPPGIGKTVLARHLAHPPTARPGSTPRCFIRATGEDLEPALGLWERLEARAGDLEIPVPAAFTMEHSLTSGQRFAAALRLLTSLGESTTSPVVLDDLHAADPDSLSLLAQVAPVLMDTGVVVIATTRGALAVLDERGRASHRALESQAQVIEMEPFDTDTVRRRLEAHGATVGDAHRLASVFRAESGGNPLVLDRLLTHCWPSEGPPPRPEAIRAASTGPAVVQRWVRELDGVGPLEIEVLGVVAELGPYASRHGVCEVLDHDLSSEVFARLSSLGLLALDTNGAEIRDRLALGHPAIAEALVATHRGLGPDLHRRLAAYLASAGGDPSVVLAQMVRALDRVPSHERRALAATVIAQAQRRGDLGCAARAWDVLLEDGDPSPHDLLAAAEAWFRAAGRPRARELARRAAPGFDPGDPDAFARAALLVGDGAEFHGDAASSVAVLQRALEILEPLDTPEARRRRVEVLAALAPLEMTMPTTGPRPPVSTDATQADVVYAVRWHWVTRPEIAQPRADTAEAEAHELGDPVLEAVAGLVWRGTRQAPRHAPARRLRSAKARRILSDHVHRGRALHAVLLDALESGDHAETRIALGELGDLAASTGDASVRWRHELTTAMLDRIGARLDAAEHHSGVAGAYGALAGEPAAVIARLEQRTIHEVDTLSDLVTVTAIASDLTSITHPPLLAGVLSLMGELHRAGCAGMEPPRHLLEALLGHLATPRSHEQNWLCALGFTASAIVATSSTRLAQAALELLSPWADLVVRESGGIMAQGHAHRIMGDLHHLVGDDAAAKDHLERARVRDLEAGFDRAVLAGDLTRLTIEIRTSSIDEVAARDRAHTLAAAGADRGLFVIAAQARRLGRGLREIALSSRQRDILEHLGTGATYQEIADGIGYSHGTVRGEITRIYAALGVESRDQAVAEAEWLGLVSTVSPTSPQLVTSRPVSRVDRV